MFNLLISGFSLLLIVFMYQQSFIYQGVEQVYLGMYNGLAEQSIVSVQYGVPTEPRFYVPLAQKIFQKYLDANMGLYTQVYSVTVTGKEVYQAYSDQLHVTFYAKTNDFQSFEREASFYLRRNF